MSVSYKRINKLALPAILAGIVEPFISLSDTFVAGHIHQLETNNLPYLAAVGLAGAMLSAFIWIFAQTRASISAFTAIYLGSKRLNLVRPLVAQTFYFNLFISLVITALAYFGSEFMFSLQNAQGALLSLTVDYFKIRILGFPFALLTFTLFGVFRGYQNTLWAMRIGVIGGSLNIVLNLLFVFVFRYGLSGIAIASVIAQAVMFLLAIRTMVKKTPFRLFWRRSLHPNFKTLLGISFNLIIRTLFLNIAFWLCNAYATSYGKNIIMVHTVLIQIWLFTSFFLDGYATAGNALSGRFLGSKNYLAIIELSKKLFRFMLLLGLALMGFMTLFYTEIGSVFIRNPEALRVFKQHFWVIIAMQPICVCTYLFDGLFKGMGFAKSLRNILFFATVLGFLPTLLLLDMLHWKLYAIWGAFTVLMLFRAGLSFIIFQKKVIPNA